MLKKLVIAFKMCFSMFTIFFFPNRDWDDDSRHYMLCFLPFVGLYIGLLWKLVFFILSMVDTIKLYYVIPFIIFIFPFLASGFIHIDGYMDICDSISCFADKNKRIEILKDPRVGSFGVIYIVLIFLFDYIVAFSLQENEILVSNVNNSILCSNTSFEITNSLILIFIPIFSRIVSCISLNKMKKINVSEYTKVNNNFLRYYVIVTVVFFTICFLFNIRFFIVCLIEMIAGFICFSICNKIYEGVNGDVSGFAITISESVALFASLLIL